MHDIFTPILPASRLCEAFKQIAANATAGDRALLFRWLEDFVDRDGKFVQEFQSTFNSSFWELYLHAALKELGLSVDYQYTRPDFLITGSTPFCIEAVTAQPPGGTPLGPSSTRDVEDAMTDLNALNREAIIRLAGAFSAKYRKFKESYSSLPHVAGRPFVLALAAFNGPAFFALSTRPIEALLYNYYVDEEAFIAGKKESLTGDFLESILKDNGSPIELGMFSSERFADISAVIYNPAATWGKVRVMSESVPGEGVVVNSLRYNPHGPMPYRHSGLKQEVHETLLDGLFVFHNPYAVNPLSLTLFKNASVAQVYYDRKAQEFVHERPEEHLLFRSIVTVRRKE